MGRQRLVVPDVARRVVVLRRVLLRPGARFAGALAVVRRAGARLAVDFAVDFLAGARLVVDLRAVVVFFAVDLRAGAAFFAVDLRAVVVFFAVDLRAGAAFFAVVFFVVVVFLAVDLRAVADLPAAVVVVFAVDFPPAVDLAPVRVVVADERVVAVDFFAGARFAVVFRAGARLLAVPARLDVFFAVLRGLVVDRPELPLVLDEALVVLDFRALDVRLAGARLLAARLAAGRVAALFAAAIVLLLTGTSTRAARSATAPVAPAFPSYQHSARKIILSVLNQGKRMA